MKRVMRLLVCVVALGLITTTSAQDAHAAKAGACEAVCLGGAYLCVVYTPSHLCQPAYDGCMMGCSLRP